MDPIHLDRVQSMEKPSLLTEDENKAQAFTLLSILKVMDQIDDFFNNREFEYSENISDNRSQQADVHRGTRKNWDKKLKGEVFFIVSTAMAALALPVAIERKIGNKWGDATKKALQESINKAIDHGFQNIFDKSHCENNHEHLRFLENTLRDYQQALQNYEHSKNQEEQKAEERLFQAEEKLFQALDQMVRSA